MKFSLVIPVAPERDAEILKSIKTLDYPAAAFETVVMSGTNPSLNRNRGAREAKGDIIVFLDDDATLPVNYLKAADAFFRKHPNVDIVGGPQLTARYDKGFAKVTWYALASMFGAWKVSTRYATRRPRLDVDETAVSSANLLCRKRVMAAVAFDTGMFPGEDPKFIADAKKAGFRVAYTPDIQLYHRRRPGIGMLMKQIFSYGEARPRKEGVRETMKMPFFFVPSLFVLYLMGLLTTISISFAFSVNGFTEEGLFDPSALTCKILFAPLYLYILLAVGFGIYDASRHRDYKAMTLLPVMYFVIHTSYGMGMIKGYVHRIIHGH